MYSTNATTYVLTLFGNPFKVYTKYISKIIYLLNLNVTINHRFRVQPKVEL